MEDSEELAELFDAANEYGEFARKLSAKCNIPQKYHLDLCEALMRACDAYDDIRYAKDRKARIRSSVTSLRDFHRHIRGACRAFRSLDARTRAIMLRAVEGKHKAAIFETITKTLPSGMALQSEERRLMWHELFADIAKAAEQCIAEAATPRGRPADDALKAFVAVLREFWVEKLGRAFYDNFQEDFGEYEPINDTSRFVVEAVENLIGNLVEGRTCRHMMRAVNGAT